MITLALLKNLLLVALGSYVLGQHLDPDTAQMIVGMLVGATIGIGSLVLIYSGRFAPTSYSYSVAR